MCSTKKILIPTLFCFLFFNHNLSFAQSDSLTELQWKQYARAHYAAASVNHEALKQALDNEYSYVVDSLAMLDIFSPLVYKGFPLRAGMERFVLNGTQKYFFPSGKVCAEINYKNNKLHGYAIMYYSNGSVYKISSYQNGRFDGRQITYYQGGIIYSSALYRNDFSLGDTLFYPSGLISVTNLRLPKKQTIKGADSYYDIQSHSERINQYQYETNYVTNYYSENGLKITEGEFFKQFGQVMSGTVRSALSKSKSNNDLSDSLILSLYDKNKKQSDKQFTSPILIDSTHDVCLNHFAYSFPVLKSAFPNAFLFDTILCPFTGATLRLAQISADKMDGKIFYYYHSGKLLAQYHLKNGCKNGSFSEFYENGQLFRIGKYKEGQLYDTLTEYDKFGMMRSQTIYGVNESSVFNIFWSDKKILQQSTKKGPFNRIVLQKIDNDGRPYKLVVPSQRIENLFFDQEGREISEKTFVKKYPNILPKEKPRFAKYEP